MDSMDSMMRVCSKDGCERKHYAKGFCRLHYRQLPENKLKIKEYDKKYTSKPEVKLKRKKYNSRPEVKLKQKEHNKKYKSKPENKLKRKEYDKQHPEISLKSQKKLFKKLCSVLGIFSTVKLHQLYISWSKTVRKTLGNYCHVCGSTKQIQVHHIFHKMKYPLLSLNENNGIPLCWVCHQQAHGKLLIQPLKNFPS